MRQYVSQGFIGVNNRAHLSKLMHRGDLFRNFSFELSADVRVEESRERVQRAQKIHSSLAPKVDL